MWRDKLRITYRRVSQVIVWMQINLNIDRNGRFFDEIQLKSDLILNFSIIVCVVEKRRSKISTRGWFDCRILGDFIVAEH